MTVSPVEDRRPWRSSDGRNLIIVIIIIIIIIINAIIIIIINNYYDHYYYLKSNNNQTWQKRSLTRKILRPLGLWDT